LWVEAADLSPDLTALWVEEDKGWRKLDAKDRCQFVTDGFMDVDADDLDLVAQFLFQPIDDGLDLGANNSVGRLKFQQDGVAGADRRLNRYRVLQQRGLPGVQDEPGHE